jgi:hypothetical protein
MAAVTAMQWPADVDGFQREARVLGCSFTYESRCEGVGEVLEVGFAA